MSQNLTVAGARAALLPKPRAGLSALVAHSYHPRRFQNSPSPERLSSLVQDLAQALGFEKVSQVILMHNQD